MAVKARAGEISIIDPLQFSQSEITKAIDAAGIAENTILIFASDNGSYYYPHSVNSSKADNDELKLNNHRANGVFKKGKGQIEEGGHRIPYIVRWPGKVNSGTVSNQMISLADHFATFAKITDYKLNKEDALDSWNILPLWEGTSTSIDYADRTIYHFNNNPKVDAVRHGKWKMIPECYYRPKKKGKKNKGNVNNKLISGQLYDLSKDPGEKDNVWSQYPEVVKELQLNLKNYRKIKYSAPHAK